MTTLPCDYNRNDGKGWHVTVAANCEKFETEIKCTCKGYESGASSNENSQLPTTMTKTYCHMSCLRKEEFEVASIGLRFMVHFFVVVLDNHVRYIEMGLPVMILLHVVDVTIHCTNSVVCNVLPELKCFVSNSHVCVLYCIESLYV